MQAVIICGGYGKRLKKIYKKTPKALIKFKKKPNLNYIIQDLKKNGVKKFLFLTNFQSEKIEKYLKKIKLKNFKILIDRNLSGTGGALIAAKKNLEREFLVVFSDLFMKINFKKFIFFSKKTKSDVNIFIHANSHPFDSDTVEFDKNGKVIKIYLKKTKRKKLNNAISGLFYLKKNFINKFNFSLNKHLNLDLVKDLINKNKSKKIFSYKSIEYIKDFGTPNRLKKVRDELNYIGKKKISAIFLDRDGVINKENGGVSKIKNFKILPNVATSIRKLNEHGIPVFIFSNQAVLAKKKITKLNFKKIIIYLDNYLSKHNAYIDDYLYCPYFNNKKFDVGIDPYFSKYRKPNPGMIRELAFKHNIKLKNSIVVGDSDRDIMAGYKMGCKTVLIKSKKIYDYKYRIKPNYVVNNLSDAIKIFI